jgi:hypothetical protein
VTDDTPSTAGCSVAAELRRTSRGPTPLGYFAPDDHFGGRDVPQAGADTSWMAWADENIQSTEIQMPLNRQFNINRPPLRDRSERRVDRDASHGANYGRMMLAKSLMSHNPSFLLAEDAIAVRGNWDC